MDGRDKQSVIQYPKPDQSEVNAFLSPTTEEEKKEDNLLSFYASVNPEIKEYLRQTSTSYRKCYTCQGVYRELHHFYDSMCPSCGDLNYFKRL